MKLLQINIPEIVVCNVFVHTLNVHVFTNLAKNEEKFQGYEIVASVDMTQTPYKANVSNLSLA